MRGLSIIIGICLAGPAWAHPGHLVDVAGHDHWVAGAAIGAAILIGILGALKGKKDSDDAPEEAVEAEEEPV